MVRKNFLGSLTVGTLTFQPPQHFFPGAIPDYVIVSQHLRLVSGIYRLLVILSLGTALIQDSKVLMIQFEHRKEPTFCKPTKEVSVDLADIRINLFGLYDSTYSFRVLIGMGGSPPVVMIYKK